MSGTRATWLFLGKAEDELCARAAAYLQQHAPQTQIVLGKRGDPVPWRGSTFEADYLVSYLSPWIVPADRLAQARVAAINFHSGPPEYPGIGCTNFALYEGATIYGVTCHVMAPAVDTGPIVRVVRFPLYPTDSVLSLTQRAYAHLAGLFHEIVDGLLAGHPLPLSRERWTRRPFRRAELNALCRLSADMSREEIARRVRATTFPGYPAASYEPAATIASEASR